MITRTFEAPSIRDAMRRVHAILGPDAVVLSTREVERVSASTPSRFEVTAAIEATDPLTEAPPLPPAPELPPPVPTPAPTPAPAAAAAPRPAAEPPPLPRARPTAPSAWSPAATVVHPNGQAPPPAAPTLVAAPDPPPPPPIEARLEAAIAELRAEVQSLSRLVLRPAAASADPEPSVRGLVAAGVEPEIASALVARARARVAPERGLAVAISPDLDGELMRLLAPIPPLWHRDPGTVVALVGPTGAGKTRTVVKLAALATFVHNARVGIVTTDTRRIGGLSTLRAFCEILGLPLRKAGSARALRGAIDALAGRDLIFIDTPGASPSDEGSLERTSQVLGTVERHLVVTAHTSAAEVRRLARRFTPGGPASVIVTKLDEARGPGALLSAATGAGAPLSHYTDGQQVPDACHAIAPQPLARAILAVAL